MKRAWLQLALLFTGVGLVAVACGDDRSVTDLGAGGAMAAAGRAMGGAGGAMAGAPSESSGGAGGAPLATCPANIFDYAGKDCSTFPEGTVCSDGADNPCEFGHAIVCTLGSWEDRESFPAPCGGAGGAGGGAADVSGGAPSGGAPAGAGGR